MRILGIETSCDETAVCVLEADGELSRPQFKVLGNAVFSQIEIHKEYGGVFPMMAKRAHAENLVPMLLEALGKAHMRKETAPLPLPSKLEELLSREPGLFENMRNHVASLERPDIDAIAVTNGPGLEPALWVGVNFAKALSLLWNIPIIPVNHMEGHIVSVLMNGNEISNSQFSVSNKIEFPAIALLISGGHTELILVRSWSDYMIIGKTKDDAVGEAYDKVARMLDLPYPGGPEISRLANEGRQLNIAPRWKLPRPMLNSGDLDFSFSGLKTAVLYLIKRQVSNPHISKTFKLSPETKIEIAQEFEEAVADVLVSKTKRALEEYRAKSLLVGGGVIANTYIRSKLSDLTHRTGGISLLLPTHHLSTDNAVMIAMAGYVHAKTRGLEGTFDFKAQGNLKLGHS